MDVDFASDAAWAVVTFGAVMALVALAFVPLVRSVTKTKRAR